jgi:hypothetical protein
MGDMKSALELAMEKIEKLDKATDEERLKWKYIPEGEKLAVRYLKHGCNLVVEISQYEENVRRYIIEGAADILTRNINLPKDDSVRKNNRKTMDGLKNLKSDKVGVENVFSKMRYIFNHYIDQGEQQRKQAYERLKTEVKAGVQEKFKQQLVSFVGASIDVERQPQFQEEWRKIRIQMDSQYLKHLDEYKQELSTIP